MKLDRGIFDKVWRIGVARDATGNGEEEEDEEEFGEGRYLYGMNS